MENQDKSVEITELERKIEYLTAQLDLAKAEVQQWTEATALLSKNAAEERSAKLGENP